MLSSEHCRDCKWWVGNAEPIDPDDRNRRHVCVRFRWRYGRPLIAGARAHVSGAIGTEPDFGCVQWEAKG
jgi:hypothetical protein